MKIAKKHRSPLVKVSYLSDFDILYGPHSEVPEYELRCTLSNYLSVKDLLALFRRPATTIIWLSSDAFIKRTPKRQSASLPTPSFRRMTFILMFRLNETVSVDMYWHESAQDSSAMNAFFRLLARDNDICLIICRCVSVGSTGTSIPVSPTALRAFFVDAPPSRTVCFQEISFKPFQCPSLFSRVDGAVNIWKIDCKMLEDKGKSLIDAITRNVGVKELDLTYLDSMSQETLRDLTDSLVKNKLVTSFSINESSFDSYHISKLCKVLRHNTTITTFRCDSFIRPLHRPALWEAISKNTSLVKVDLGETGTWDAEDQVLIANALRTNETLEVIKFELVGSNQILFRSIKPKLNLNRHRRHAREISREGNPTTRWALLGNALRHRDLRLDPDVMYIFLTENKDTFIANMPKGKRVLAMTLRKLDQQRAVLLRQIGEYEMLECKANRKRLRDDLCQMFEGDDESSIDMP